MMTLTVTGASDSHRGPVFFLVGPDSQRGPDCPDVYFLSVSAQIFWLLWGFRLLPPEFWPSRALARGSPKTPRGRTPSPPPLATSLFLTNIAGSAHHWRRARVLPKRCKRNRDRYRYGWDIATNVKWWRGGGKKKTAARGLTLAPLGSG